MSELKPCHNDLPDRLRWWAAHCDMTSCGCRISSLMMQAADMLERCDRPDQFPGPAKLMPDNAPLTMEELRVQDGQGGAGMTVAAIYLLIVGSTVVGVMVGEPTAAPAFNDIFNGTHFLLACGIIGICTRLDDIKKDLEKRHDR